uniref:G_PROTEIN_RECEP_F1_2 domain-containing protein n=1 Tax=Heterorhabditis bacteriophora TaxID=37862 RepID=A0A1I7XIJ4_HETBA
MLSIKFCLGLLLGAVSFCGLLFNIAVLFAVLLIVVRHQKSPIFIISASNIFIDSLQLILAVGYLTPSIISNQWLFPGGRSDPILVFMGGVFLMLWYNGSATQILVAVNRFVVVCMPHIHFFCTRNVSILVTMIYPLSMILAWISQYVSPCCQFSFDHTFLSYSYTLLNNTNNYSNTYIDLPLNSLSSGICVFSYAYIIYNVRVQNKIVDVALTDAGRHKRRMKEYTLILVTTVRFKMIAHFQVADSSGRPSKLNDREKREILRIASNTISRLLIEMVVVLIISYLLLLALQFVESHKSRCNYKRSLRKQFEQEEPPEAASSTLFSTRSNKGRMQLKHANQYAYIPFDVLQLVILMSVTDNALGCHEPRRLMF